MNVLKIEPPRIERGSSASRAAAGAWELRGGSLLAFAANAANAAGLRDFLAAEQEGLAGRLGSLGPEEVPLVLADLLHRGVSPGTPAASVLALYLYKEGAAYFLASGGAAAYVAPAAGGPVRRLLPAEVVRLPIAGEALVALVSGELEAPLEERLLAALQSARGPEALESVLRGPLERAGGALLAFTAPGASGEAPRRQVPEEVEHEIAVLRREVERRLVRLDARLKDLEDLVAGFATAASRPRFSFPGLPSLTRPRPQPLPLRRPTLGLGEDAERGDDLPQFERGLDVPVAANWSRPLLYVTGGVTLLLFLLVQLFCAAPTPGPRRITPQPKAVPPAAAPAAKPRTPAGVLFVTPSNEPEGTEGAAGHGR